jgi:hypothetical protein
MSVTIVGNNTPTAGGVVYGDGTNYVSTGAGTGGQVLTSNGASAPSWTTPSSGAMTLISTQTASSSASLSWTGLSGYDKYLLVFENFTSSSGGGYPILQIGTGSTPTYITSGYIINITVNWNGTVVADSWTGRSYIPLSCYYNGNIGSAPTSGFVNLFGCNSTANTYFSSQGYSNTNNTGTYESDSLNGFISNSSSVTAIKVYFSGANITSGSASLYGISS